MAGQKAGAVIARGASSAGAQRPLSFPTQVTSGTKIITALFVFVYPYFPVISQEREILADSRLGPAASAPRPAPQARRSRRQPKLRPQVASPTGIALCVPHAHRWLPRACPNTRVVTKRTGPSRARIASFGPSGFAAAEVSPRHARGAPGLSKRRPHSVAHGDTRGAGAPWDGDDSFAWRALPGAKNNPGRSAYSRPGW